jgi:hypothetical protein
MAISSNGGAKGTQAHSQCRPVYALLPRIMPATNMHA